MKATRAEDNGNEQLAFVSGTVLAWGALLVNMWPIVARMQTGMHDQITQRSLTFASIAPAAVVCHRAATLVVALGIGMMLFGTIHVIARGLAITSLSEPVDVEGGFGTADQIAQRAYLVIQIYWAVTSAVLLFTVITLPLIIGLQRVLDWIPFWSALSITGVMFAAIVIINILRKRRGLITIGVILKRLGRGNFLVAIAAMFLVWMMTMELAYVAEVSVSHPIVSRSQSELFVISVSLGGAVSDPTEAQLAIIQGDTTIQSLKLRPLVGGSYIAFAAAPRSLPEGDYQARLTYPHTYVSVDTPMLSQAIDKRAGFIVVP